MSDVARLPRRRWRRRLLVLCLVLVTAVVLAPLALGLAPVRRWVAARASAAVGRTVTIGGLSAAWWSGIEVRDLEVHNPQGWTGDPLLVVDRVQATVRWLPLLTGTVDADVEVDRPVVTRIQGADGRSNLDGLGEPDGTRTARSRRGGPRDGASLPRLALRVRDGALVSFDARTGSGATPERIDGIQVEAHTRPDGAVEGTLDARLRRATAAGGDAPLHVEARLDARGSGPVTATLPAIDLARWAATVGGALGVDDLAGLAQLDVHLTLDGEGGAQGQAAATVDGLRWARAGGVVTAKRLAVTATPVAAGGALRADLALEVRDLRAVGFSRRDEGLVEPLLRLAGTVTREENGDLRFGDATQPLRLEGRTLQGHVSGAVTGLSGDRSRADLAAHLDLSLSPTLGRLVGALASPEDDLQGVLTLDASAHGTEGRLDLRLGVTGKGLVVGGAPGSEPYREPSATATVEGVWDGAAETLTLSRADLAAGAVKGSIVPPLLVRRAPTLQVTGGGTLDADLTRLAHLRALVPALSSVASGTLHAEAKGRGGEATDVEWSVRASNLGFAPGALSSRGYLERDVVVVGRLATEGGGASRLTVDRLSSALVSLVEGSGPVRLRLAPEGPSIEGRAAVNVNLQAASLALDRAMGLAPGEAISGWLQVAGSGTSTASGARFEVTLAGRDLVPPGERARGTLDGVVVVRTDAAGRTTAIERATLKGYGIDLTASGVLAPRGEGIDVTTATLAAEVDLAAARPLLGASAGLPADATLSGRLRADLTVKPAAAGRVVEGKTTIQRLVYRGPRDPKTGHVTSVEEPVVTLEQRAVLDATPGLVQVERLVLASEVLSASVAGTSRQAGGESDLNLSGRLQGDAALLARRLARILGPGYEDTTGEGRVEGTFLLAGSTAHDGRDLRVDANLTFRKFASAGLSLDTGRLSATRPDPRQPLRLTLVCGVNGGTLDAQGQCALGQEESPWDARATIRGLDTSPLLLHEGTGRYLALVLPAVVPADATSQVLSGRMDADLDLRSRSIHEPAAVDTLTGSGRVLMKQGEVKQSTLFGGLGGGAGKGLAQLVGAVPGVGATLAELQRAVAFQELSSTFTLGRRQVHLNPVVLVSPRVDVRFTGVVGFDGKMDLRIPVRLGGEAGQGIERFLPDRTIPVRVRGTSGKPLVVTPDVKLESLGKGLLEELLKRR